MILIGRELLAWGDLLLVVGASWLLTGAARLVAESAVLLPKRTLLLIRLIELSGWGADITAANGCGRVRSFEEHVGLVHHRVIDELPLVIGLLLVVDANRRILACAGNP